MASTSSGDPFSSKNQPQTLDELLERQWEQGSQFLMEQASHFDSKFQMERVASNFDRKFPVDQAGRADSKFMPLLISCVSGS